MGVLQAPEDPPDAIEAESGPTTPVTPPGLTQETLLLMPERTYLRFRSSDVGTSLPPWLSVNERQASAIAVAAAAQAFTLLLTNVIKIIGLVAALTSC